MSSSLRIVVTGLAATYPFGGVFWDYLQYPLGFLRLGHDVLYLEDTGQWCYDPRQHTFVADGSWNAQLLSQAIARFMPELNQRWFYRDAQGQCFGLSWDQVVTFCRSADLFLHISGSCLMRPEYFQARCVALLDSDPMYTQAAVPDYVAGTVSPDSRARLDQMLRHHVFFTFGENIGAPDCAIPTELFAWQPTRQPIVLDRFEPWRVPLEQRRRVLTTVASWEPAQHGPCIRGVQYWGKSVEFLRFLDLPRLLDQRLGSNRPVLELAMSGRAPKEKLLAHGWCMVDPTQVSADPGTYRDYLAHSLAEWSVAKNAYVAARTGWFSCRSACYLALGVPVILQDTGFSRFLPTGRGLLCFDTPDQAVAAIESLLRDPAAHARAALEIAHEYFDAKKVLSRLLDQALRSPVNASPNPTPSTPPKLS